MRNSKLNLAFFTSHNGSGMRMVVDATRTGELSAIPKVVISNNADATALEFASDNHIVAIHVSQTSLGAERDLDAELLSTLIAQEVDLIVLSGYLRKLGPKVLHHFHRRILNVHPSLLPLFGGKGMYGEKVHSAVIAARKTESGATVHLVDAGYDTGRIICQKTVSVTPNDTPEILAMRVANIEGGLLIEAIREIIAGSVRLDAE